MQHIIIAQCHVHSGNAGQCGACWLDVNVRIVNDPSWLCIAFLAVPIWTWTWLWLWLWLWLTFRHSDLLHCRSLLVITSLCCYTLSSQSRLQLRR